MVSPFWRHDNYDNVNHEIFILSVENANFKSCDNKKK